MATVKFIDSRRIDLTKGYSHNHIDIVAPTSFDIQPNRGTAVISTEQLNNGNFSIDIPGARMFKAVAMKLIAPNKELIDVRCKANIVKSIDAPECD